ncbi:18005_t:CDS:2 [Dentiscutata erythropus]|uniref:18005_t:CDS:1 n=1 Tax=Dentiscutata erythropus TaxID=1348616 RepID=A0A9N9FRX9_9GLOM|nr:18005_t:CDS:2 [Dentiscutata erythropus]
MSDTEDIIFNKAYRIFDTVPGFGTFFSLVRAVWYGFHGNIKEAAISAVNAFQGSVCDALIFTGIEEPIRIMVIHTMVDNTADLIVDEAFEWLKNKINHEKLESETKKLLEKKDHPHIDHGTEQYVFVVHDNNEENQFKKDMEQCFNEMWHIGPVSVYLQWENRDASSDENFNHPSLGKLEYKREDKKITILKEDHYYYYFTGNFKPLKLDGHPVLKYGILSLDMMNLKNEFITSTNLYIGLAENIRYFIPVENNKFMIPYKNQRNANIVFRDRSNAEKIDAIFYFDNANGRIVHLRTGLVLETESKESLSYVILKDIDHSVNKKDFQKWDIIYYDKGYFKIYLRANHNLLLDSADEDDNLMLKYKHKRDLNCQNWSLEEYPL